MTTLAVFDDEFVVVEGIKAILKKMNLNYEVVGTACDGLIALQVIEKVQPKVIMTDICMPGIDGLQLIKEAKKINPRGIFIIMSGFQEFEYARTALDLGVIGYVDKPITKEKIRTILEKATLQIRNESSDSENRKEYFKKLHELVESITVDIQRCVAENITSKMEKILSVLECLYLDLENYKSESYKLICSLLGVFFEGHPDYVVNQHFPSYKNLALTHSKEEVNHYILTLIDRMVKKIESLQAGSHNPIILNILSYIADHYSEDFGLNEMADMVQMTPGYLSLLFREEVGTSFIKYLTHFRIQKAKVLLLQGGKVVEVSHAVGYMNYRYFCEVFKRYEGKTPSEYKGVRRE